ncbi:MAG: glycerol-3-phosphate dehydrogenase/oxidase [Ginsengibacter sp.]
MNLFDRNTLIKSLKETPEWDILIIGGGATGLGVAVDAAFRGFRTLLVEQEDFAKGTSSRSTKLVHGGVRYLAQGNIALVKEALKERGFLMKNAPHLTKNESFIIPCFSWVKGIFYATGLKMYDWLAGKKSLGKSKLISKKEVLKRLPAIKKDFLKCGVLYHDGIFDDARLAINLAQTCVEKGGVTLNYCRVISLVKNQEGKLCGAKIIDQESKEIFTIKAKVIVNATGVFADEILKMDKPETKPLIRPSQGIHLVLDKSFLQSDDAIMIPHTDDGRVLFAIPWHEKVLIGTTDTPLNSHSLEPRALESEIEFVLKNAGNYLSKKPGREDVLSVFAGLRPLAASGDESAKTKEISRSHKIIISSSGLVSVVGGKWTTYRKMAVDMMLKIMERKMLPHKNGNTEDLQIHGYSTEFKSPSPLSYYGSDEKEIKKLIDENESWAQTLSTHTNIIIAQVVWAVRSEMARTAEDVLARRTRVLFFDAKLAISLAPKVAEIMMKELNRDEEWKIDQINTFRELATGYLLNKT